MHSHARKRKILGASCAEPSDAGFGNAMHAVVYALFSTNNQIRKWEIPQGNN